MLMHRLKFVGVVHLLCTCTDIADEADTVSIFLNSS